MVKLSEIPDYLQYGTCLSRGDFHGALQALERCLAIPEVKEDVYTHAFLTASVGQVYFHLGEKERGMAYLDASEQIDPSSLMSPYLNAKFLAERQRDFRTALRKCDAIIAHATAHPFPASELESFDSGWYVRKADELKAFCLAQAAQGEREGSG